MKRFPRQIEGSGVYDDGVLRHALRVLVQCATNNHSKSFPSAPNLITDIPRLCSTFVIRIHFIKLTLIESWHLRNGTCGDDCSFRLLLLNADHFTMLGGELHPLFLSISNSTGLKDAASLAGSIINGGRW